MSLGLHKYQTVWRASSITNIHIQACRTFCSLLSPLTIASRIRHLLSYYAVYLTAGFAGFRRFRICSPLQLPPLFSAPLYSPFNAHPDCPFPTCSPPSFLAPLSAPLPPSTPPPPPPRPPHPPAGLGTIRPPQPLLRF